MSINYEPDANFVECYSVAKKHFEIQSDGGLVWQKCWPVPPFQEHMSFALGNQKFFIRLYDIDGELIEPPNQGGTIRAAEMFNGFACFIPMQKNNDVWQVVENGWGLYSHADGLPINPTELVSDEKILLNDAEFHERAVSCYLEMLMDKLPDASFYPPQFDKRVFPSLRIQRPNQKFAEAFSIFAYRSNEEISDNDERKERLPTVTEHLMELGLKHHVVDVKLISEAEYLDDGIAYSPLHRLEPCASIFTKLETLDLL